MPAPITEPIMPSAAAGIAAALVGAGIAPLGRNPDTNGHQPRSSFEIIEDLGLEGKDLQAQLEILKQDLEKQNRIVDGAENMLEVFDRDSRLGQERRDPVLRDQVEGALDDAKSRIAILTRKLEQLREQSGNNRRGGAFPNSSAGPSAAVSRMPFWTNPATVNGRIREENTDREDYHTAHSHATSQLQLLSALSKQHSQAQSSLQYSSGLFSYTSSTNPSSSWATSIGGTTSPSSPSGGNDLNGGLKISDAEIDHARIKAMHGLVDTLQKNVRVRYALDISELVKTVFPALADYATKESRTAAYRLLRYAMVDNDSVTKLREQDIDYYLVRTFSRDSKHGIEKESALKLIRKIVEVGSKYPTKADVTSKGKAVGTGSVPVSEAVIRALIAVADHQEDPLRFLCLLTLSEIVLIDIELVSKSGGLRSVLTALTDGPAELAPIIAQVFLHIIDAPRTRRYLTPGVDLEIALSGITDAYIKTPGHKERMRTSTKVVCTILRSWSGLIYLCSNNMQSIISLVDTLRIPSMEGREVIIDMFFDVLNIEVADWGQAFMDGRRLTMIGPPKTSKQPQLIHDRPTPKSEKLNLTHQFISLLLVVFVESGLIEALVDILEEQGTSTELPRKATLLLGEIMQLANRVLPSTIAARIQALPRLFSLASNYEHGEAKQFASSTLSSIESLNRNRARLNKVPEIASRKRANSVEDTMRRGQRQVERSKIKRGMEIDDKGFQVMLIDTQVMLHKEATKWNLDSLTELIEGPLLNPKRFEEAMKVSRFGRKLMSFFYPNNRAFSEMKNTKSNARYIKLGCTLMTTLISTPDGQRYLMTEDTLLKQIVECLEQIDPQALSGAAPTSASNTELIFSKTHMDKTISFGYFEMLGTLSRYPDGIEILEKLKVFNCLYHLGDLRSREDLTRHIIENFDCTVDGHPRLILSKALTSRHKYIRLDATDYLGKLIRMNPKANEWMLRLLLTQLYDPVSEVCEKAIFYLQEACEDMSILEMVVQMQPILDHLGEIGHPLLLKFMSTQIGFQYLYNADYIDREMDGWFHEQNYQYLVQVEVYLARALTPIEGSEESLPVFEGTVPPHFYGEMAKTTLGCKVLEEKGHFPEFAHFIRQHGLESEDFEIINKLKSVLWAVGNIGATTGGLPFLEDEDIIRDIVEIASKSEVLSVRGTCFFVLGLISSTPQGAEVLDEYEWEATVTPLGLTTGLCLPMDIEKFLYINPWEPYSDDSRKGLKAPTDPMEREILKGINNLSNTVIQNQASRTLSRYKHRPHGRRAFQSIPLFYRALHILGTQRFRLPVRRYVLDLFDIKLDPAVINLLHEFGKKLAEPEPQQEEKAPVPQIVAPRPSTATSTPDVRHTRSPGPPPTAPPARPGFRSRRNTRIGAAGLGINVQGIDGMASGAPPEAAVDPQTYDYEAMERARNAALGQLHAAVEELRISRENEEQERERKEKERKENEKEKLALLALEDDDKKFTRGIVAKPKETIVGFDA
ncbi:Protein ste16 [Schizosaccharomyces pombe 972h-] [Rhizoctonia solani]|uniref:Protein ste16 [Schizosaccharomyces pombe 972h-] n=1 Tax=Rhizoctonia solani TaxID=456999 RepID=A0A0K6G2B7_9AGAM|nr:Protein ste16 [Schizosaccharomyces pombe 972h-] [Rhizoctonia solani]